MAQIVSSNSDVTNASTTVQFNASPDLSSVPVGSVFIRTGDAVSYLVAAINDTLKTVTLNAPYSGVTGAGVASVVHTAFTAIDGIPYPEKNDVETATITKLAVLKIQQLLTSVPSAQLNNYSATTDPGVGDDDVAGYSIGSRWVRSNTSKTWTATSVATGAAVWDQEDNDSGTGITDHTALTNIGTNTHAQIDTHIANAALHRIINDAGTLATELFSAAKIIVDLAGKANISHNHVESDITDLQSYLLNITNEALTSLANVSVASPVDGEVLTFDLGSGGLWINAAPTGGGGGSTIQDNFVATAPPSMSDDNTSGYEVGSRWLVGSAMWIATDVTTGAAFWLHITNEGFLATQFSEQVLFSVNNGQENNPGDADLDSSDLELGNDTDQPNRYVGLRFPVAIAQGATIDTCAVQFRADETSSSVVTLKIEGELATDSSEFVNKRGQLTQRTRTVASVLWTPPDWVSVNDQGAAQLTPDLKTILQEIIDQPGFQSGYFVTLIISLDSGTGKRTADSKDSTTSGAPELQVTYNSGSSLDVKVQTGDDDCEEYTAGGVETSVNGIELSAYQDVDYPRVKTAYFLITTPLMSPGNNISEAYMQFTARDSGDEPAEIEIWCEAIDSATPPDPAVEFDLSTRAKTTASVKWKPVPWASNERTTKQRTPDLSVIIKEVTDRAGWFTANPIGFIFSGTGSRRVETTLGAGSSDVPELVLRYTSLVEPRSTHDLLADNGVLSHDELDAHAGDGLIHSRGFLATDVSVDPVSVGFKSIGIGSEVVVKGQNSVAIGYKSEVNKHDGVALGSDTYSHSQCEIAIGCHSPTNGKDGRASVVGQYIETDGLGTTLMLGTTASGSSWVADELGIDFENNTIQTWDINLVGFNKTSGDSARWRLHGLTKRGIEKWDLTLINSTVVESSGEGTMLADITPTVAVDVATGRIGLSVSDGGGGASSIVRLVASCYVVQVKNN